jgi:hypothetical protein
VRTIKIGDTLATAEFQIIYKSYCEQMLFFWDDLAATQPSDLSSVTSATLEVTVDAVTTVVWTGSVISNQVKFSLTATQTTVGWDTRPYVLVLLKGAERHVVLSGEVVVQR